MEERPYEEEFHQVLEYLRNLAPKEHEDLLRRAGILDQEGRLAERYKKGGEPVNLAEP